METSNEAKQAAAKVAEVFVGEPTKLGKGIESRLVKVLQDFAATTTAKAREDNLQLSQALQCCKAERVVEKAKAREEWQWRFQQIAVEKEDLRVQYREQLAKAQEELRLLEQQVERLTLDRNQWLESFTRLAHQQPSAPTADVEKIGEIALVTLQRMRKAGDSPHPETYRFLMESLTQARAPLVAALEKLDAIAARACSDREGTKMIWASAVMAVTRAALTGTGEKECPR